jgi:hypothetical protein
MKQTFSIFVAATLLLASSSAEAARNSNLILPQTPPISTAPPQTNPIGGTLPGGFPQTNPNEGVGSIQNFGALPGEPGSPTYNPNAALPPLNNPAGTNEPATSSGTSSGM